MSFLKILFVELSMELMILPFSEFIMLQNSGFKLSGLARLSGTHLICVICEKMYTNGYILMTYDCICFPTLNMVETFSEGWFLECFQK